MLPFIIGGVALATVGYGLKLYCENEGCFDGAMGENRVDESMEALDDIKSSLLHNTLKEFTLALHEMKNHKFQLNTPELSTDSPIMELAYLDGDTTPTIKEFTAILQATKTTLESRLNTIDTLLGTSDDYESYDTAQKEYIAHTLKLAQKSLSTMTLPLSYDGETISRATRREFGKLRELEKQI